MQSKTSFAAPSETTGQAPSRGKQEQAAADVGFSRATMWYGSLADSSPISSNEIYSFAQQYAHAQHILIGHLNYEGVISVLDKIKALLDQRGLTTVTLRDYYGG